MKGPWAEDRCTSSEFQTEMKWEHTRPKMMETVKEEPKFLGERSKIEILNSHFKKLEGKEE